MHSYRNKELDSLYIFKFWFPLSATWLMMAAESPILTSIIARMIDPKFNLAAYGVSHSVSMIIESPIIMLLSATIAMVHNGPSFRSMRAFAYALNILVTVGMFLVVIPPVFDFVAGSLLFLPPLVAEKTYIGLWILIPWPAAIGFRRFYQGLLIKAGETRRVTYGTFVRIIGILIGGFSVALFTSFDGIVVGAFGLSMGVVCETLATRYMARGVIRKYKKEKSEATTKTDFAVLSKYYYPFALTSLITMSTTPFITFFINRSPFALESLAVLPVIESMIFIFRSFGFSYTDAALALLGKENENHKALKRFAVYIGSFTVIGLGLVAFTPFVSVAYQSIYGLSPQLTAFAVLPTQIMVLFPALSVVYAVQRAVIINMKQNKHVTISVVVEIGTTVLLMAILTNFYTITGIYAAAFSTICGRVLACIYMYFPYKMILKKQSEQLYS